MADDLSCRSADSNDSRNNWLSNRLGTIVKVLPIKSFEAEPWLLLKHYAKRIPSISYAFGLYDDRILVGVVTFGTPASSSLRSGLAGEKNIELILELNRLCIDSDKKNAASILVGRSLSQLPKPSIVVSYADTAQNHIGYVYQACNFIYTGLSAKRTDWKVKGMEHLHGQTIVDISRGQINRAEFMRETYGDDFYLEERSRKHRYVYICANKGSQKKSLKSEIMYKEEPYPKGATQRYDATCQVPKQSILF